MANRVLCAVCHVWNELPDTGPQPDHRAPSDFDTRPGGAERYSLSSWLQMCGSCGYAAESIAVASPEASGIVSSDDYQACRHEVEVPPAARPFFCYAKLLSRLHMHADAGWSALHAAWVCDDLQEDEAAGAMRRLALDHWHRGKAAGQQFGDDLATEFALATDIYRRLGEFEQAVVACSEGLDIDDIPPVLEKLLRRQMVLIQARDTSVHNMGELISSPAA
ncbi:MAG TPA: hypothetical protein VES20_13785 [Bryobacteraceae bacterium]|nr:hypothetical protein [Bryobacteraceae bacterium]